MAEVHRAANKKNKYSRSSLFLLVVLVVLSLPAFVPALQAAEVTLAWDPNPEPSVAGYRVYYGTASGVYTNAVDAGRRTELTITGLEPGRTYYCAATAYSATGDESGFSAEVIYTTAGQPSSSSGGNVVAVRCFIATAAYGSALAPEVLELREFRDRCLLTNRAGRAFVDWYYSISPPIAAFLSEHEALRTAVRWGLAPVVYAVKYPATALVMILMIPAVVIVRKRRKRRTEDKG